MLVNDILLSKKSQGGEGKELAANERRIFADEINISMGKELASWVEHDAFHAKSRSQNRTGAQIIPSRWVLTWKWDPVLSCWGIKSRLVVKGVADRQADRVLTRSPTAARTAQRMLVSASVQFDWDLISIDIATAFLQGDWLRDQTTVDGQRREVIVDLPDSAWALMPAGSVPAGMSDPVAVLQKAVYGLKDAPALWANLLTRTL